MNNSNSFSPFSSSDYLNPTLKFLLNPILNSDSWCEIITGGSGDEKEVLRLNLQRMQSWLVELERPCKEMSRVVELEQASGETALASDKKHHTRLAFLFSDPFSSAPSQMSW